MKKKNSYTFEDLIECANGRMFGEGNAKLPSPPMLMFNKITKIHSEGGSFNKGEVKAELDIDENLWFFMCHFKNDPVMPGCLGLDAMWQLLGFYLGWLGNPGHGRALGVSEVKFTGEILTKTKIVKYIVNIKRLLKKGETCVGLADGLVFADEKEIYTAKNLKVGLFKS